MAIYGVFFHPLWGVFFSSILSSQKIINQNRNGLITKTLMLFNGNVKFTFVFNNVKIIYCFFIN